MPTAATNATVTSSPSSSSLSSSPALSLKQESYPATLQSIAPALLFPTQSDLVKETAPRRLLPKATDDPIVNITDLIKPDAGPTTPTNRKRAHSKDGDDISAEEEKRRRNTAASARFRAKKKMRERALEQTVRDMTTKSETLEERMESLEREIKWLRGLLIEKHQLENEPPSSTISLAGNE
ncbi:hypothetical protein BCR43DRAFT_493351 [Syncephalastrum racemosum]|uniref:BZIP domain-containing protein n=1 Tax=Syncephalastrum racemosum TaxID=13706 RepID=A0A1X2HBR8_SYNRA|nr:hypothetical protein BCR43DRAFT_493351 [Syncephalastrum racemosum]